MDLENREYKEWENEDGKSYRRQASKSFWSFDRELEPKKISAKILAIYLIIGSLWILLSDEILAVAINDKDAMTIVSIIKGWVYVIASGMIIFMLVFSTLKRINLADKELLKSYEKLASTHKKLECAYEEITASEEELRQQFELLQYNQGKLTESEERYRLISEATNDGIWEEMNGNRSFSDRWFEITGYSREDLDELGGWKNLIHPEDVDDALKIMHDHMETGTPYYICEYRMKMKDGNYRWIQARGKGLFDENGRVIRMAGSHTDITELKQSQLELQHLAYHDTLTGLPNRLSLYETTSRLRCLYPDIKKALIFMDADNFKLINDTLGHVFGDQLLRKISERLASLKSRNCCIFRLGGDEFLIFAEEIANAKEAEAFADRILSDFKAPFKVEDSVLHVNVSMGISIYPDHGRSIEELLRCADIAMYTAKEEGKSKYVLYIPQMIEKVKERVCFERNLHLALENEEFEIFYQPQLDIKNNKISGFEALLRWKSPEFGYIPPSKFIKIAEDTHMIIPLGAWVLKHACSFIKDLHRKGYPELTMAVNISMLQLVQDDFVDMVTDTLKYYDLQPQFLELEITESILMESVEVIEEKLGRLHDRGVLISLDDFGKGYSSLNYLKQLPISTLKVDKSFVDQISSGKENKILTGHIVSIGRSMGLNVVAEGVETEDQLNYLIKHKCDRIQGYYFSKPVPEHKVIDVIENNKKEKSCN